MSYFSTTIVYLKKENDEASKKRLVKLESELTKLEEKNAALNTIWKKEKAALQGTTTIKADLEKARYELESARRSSDLTRMAELQYGRIPEHRRHHATHAGYAAPDAGHDTADATYAHANGAAAERHHPAAATAARPERKEGRQGGKGGGQPLQGHC